MVLALMLPLLVHTPSGAGAVAGRADEPPIKVWLNQDGSYQYGDRARVYMRMVEDGYLVVLRADSDGRVRVLFPVDPADNNFLQGDKTIEIRGRGDREAFSIDERNGPGVVLAARSVVPFHFDDFVLGDHWNYAVLDTMRASGDVEGALVDIVRRMSVDGHFDYDDVSYTVGAPRTSYRPDAPCYGCYSPYYGWPSHFGVGLGFGSGFAFASSACFGPFFDPFFCDPFFFFHPFFFRPVFFHPFFFDPFFGPVIIQTFVFTPFIIRHGVLIVFAGRGFTGANRFSNRGGPGFRGPFVFKHLSPGAKVVDMGPRFRIPQGALISRALRTSAPASMPVRVRELAARPAPTPGRMRDGVSMHAPGPMQVRDRNRRMAPVAPARVPERVSRTAPWPVRVPWSGRGDDRGAVQVPAPVRGRTLIPERDVPMPVRERADARAGRAIPNVRVLERPEAEQGGFAPSEQWGGRSGAWSVLRVEGRGWSAPRSSGSARAFVGRGWGGGHPR